MSDEVLENRVQNTDSNAGIDPVRLRKLEELRRMGIDPYPHFYDAKDRIPELIGKSQIGLEAKIAGRIVAWRGHGKTTFLDLREGGQTIQLYLNQRQLGEDVYSLLKDFFDIGDFMGAEGTTFNTRAGEFSMNVRDFAMLSKSLRPLPDKHHGLVDPEIRYSQRFLDLIANPEVAEIFMKRSKIISQMRKFLDGKGYMEVEIPTLQPIYGGASAAPFITHVNSLNQEHFLSISPELYLKKLIVGGFQGVYTIGKNFRNEGIDSTHNPEFTMMEAYMSNCDYHKVMELTEEMISAIAIIITGKTKINYQGKEIELRTPWQRLTMYDAVKQYTGTDVEKMNQLELKTHLAARSEEKIGDYRDMSKGEIVLGLFGTYVEPHLDGPVFITDHPIESTPLCKPHREKPGLAERFEPYIAGMEIGNAYTELNDPILQRKLFEEQIRREGQNNPHLRLDENFLRALEYGMPPTGGLGIGIDRLTMILTDQKSIKEVILFPFTKAELR